MAANQTKKGASLEPMAFYGGYASHGVFGSRVDYLFKLKYSCTTGEAFE